MDLCAFPCRSIFAGRTSLRRSGCEQVSFKARVDLSTCSLDSGGQISSSKYQVGRLLHQAGWQQVQGQGEPLKAVFILVLCAPFPSGRREATLTPTKCPGFSVCCWKDVLQMALAHHGLPSAVVTMTRGAPRCQQTPGSWLQLLVPFMSNKRSAQCVAAGS